MCLSFFVVFSSGYPSSYPNALSPLYSRPALVLTGLHTAFALLPSLLTTGAAMLSPICSFTSRPSYPHTLNRLCFRSSLLASCSLVKWSLVANLLVARIARIILPLAVPLACTGHTDVLLSKNFNSLLCLLV